jgi:hypothetical protein
MVSTVIQLTHKDKKEKNMNNQEWLLGEPEPWEDEKDVQYRLEDAMDDLFNQWYEKKILETVMEGIELIRKDAEEVFTTRPLNLSNCNSSLIQLIDKLRVLQKVINSARDSFCGSVYYRK